MTSWRSASPRHGLANTLVADRVLDASAFLALAFDEPGAEAVSTLLEATVAVSAVNWAEVLTRLVDEGASIEAAGRRLRLLRAANEVEVVAYDRDDAEETAGLREATRTRGLSLGDRACLALAKKLGVPAVTADRRWLEVDISVTVETIR